MRRFWLVLLGVVGLLGCEVAPPWLIEARPPGDTRDPSGPYRVSVLLGGDVDSGYIEWRLDRGTPERTPLRDRGEGLWEADLPGAPFGSFIELGVVANGPDGQVRAPEAGIWSFHVRFEDGPCLVDGDCLPGEICDRLRRLCKPAPERCADDGDCPQDHICGPDGRCRFRPSTCEADAECGPGLMCENGLCVSRPECVEDADCPEGAVCLSPPGRCVATGECVFDADCPADRPRCQQGTCEAAPEPCGGPCPDGTRCVDDQCVPEAGPCDACPADRPRCHPDEQRCVGCFADGHCGPDQHCALDVFTCADGVRRRPCLDCSDGCGAGQVCVSDGPGLCMPQCGRDAACPPGFFCDGQACQPESFCWGTECTADADCPAGVCEAGACDRPQRCLADADCAADRRCDAEGRCVPRATLCRQASDCGAGAGCLAGRCVPTRFEPHCQPCPSDACIDAGLCAPFFDNTPVCLVPCGSDRRCPNGSRCQDIAPGFALCMPNDECRPAQPCTPDAYEPNNGPQEATPLRPFDNQISATICPGDVDVFTTPGGHGFVDVFTTDVPLAITLHRGNGEVEAVHLLAPFQNSSFEVPAGVQLISVRADGESGRENAYEMFTFFEPAQSCDDDLLEPNDSPDRSTRLRFGARIDAVICPPNPDWFEVRLRSREVAEITVSADGFEGLWVRISSEGGGSLFEDSVEVGTQRTWTLQNPRNRRSSLYLHIDCLACLGAAPYRLQVDPG